MSGLVVGSVFASGLWNGADLMVMVKLADYADDNGQCYPGYDTIARMTGLKKRSVMRIIARLEADGRCEARGLAGSITKKGKGGRGKSNRYEINLMRLEACKAVWYRNPDYPERFSSFEAMASDPAYRPLLAKALPALPPIKGDSDDTKKGDSDDTKNGDSETAKGDSRGSKGDSRAAETVPGESSESLMESSSDSGAHARASAETARAAPSLDEWRMARLSLKQELGEEEYLTYLARLRYPGEGRVIAPDPDAVDRAVQIAGPLLKEKGFRVIVSEGGGREVAL